MHRSLPAARRAITLACTSAALLWVGAGWAGADGTPPGSVTVGPGGGTGTVRVDDTDPGDAAPPAPAQQPAAPPPTAWEPPPAPAPAPPEAPDPVPEAPDPVPEGETPPDIPDIEPAPEPEQPPEPEEPLYELHSDAPPEEPQPEQIVLEQNPAELLPDPVQPPSVPAAVPVRSGRMAQTAATELTVVAPQIASTPDTPETAGAVGLPVWFWVADPGPTTTGPLSASTTAGAVTVNLNARFTGLTIETGDGATIECSGPGTPYPGSGVTPSPDCGHVYQRESTSQPGGLYEVRITAHWDVDWSSTTGRSGQMTLDVTTTKQLRIGSYQAVALSTRSGATPARANITPARTSVTSGR